MAEDPYAPNTSSNFNSLSSDLVELILSFLPVPSLLRASAVCKHWYFLISSPIFPSDPKAAPRPWFFLYGLHNTSSRNHQSFAFDPQSDSWFSLPVLNDEDPSSSSYISSGSDGFLFTTTPSFSYTRLFRPSVRKVTSPLRFPRINPLLGVYRDDSRCLRFIVVGGVRFIGNLVDIEDRPAVEIYDPASDSWDICPPLPADFSSGNSSLSLSSALLGNRLYVIGISSCFISSFDLRNRIWSDVQTLRPPGLVFSFLVACRNRLVLAGMCIGPAGASFNLWEVNQRTMELSEIAAMPSHLLNGLVDSEDDDKFESLKCVGLGDLIYVFNEDYHKKYPACVCEISGECRWRRLPDLPSPVNKFHKVISFCSAVSIQTVLLLPVRHSGSRPSQFRRRVSRNLMQHHNFSYIISDGVVDNRSGYIYGTAALLNSEGILCAISVSRIMGSSPLVAEALAVRTGLLLHWPSLGSTQLWTDSQILANCIQDPPSCPAVLFGVFSDILMLLESTFVMVSLTPRTLVDLAHRVGKLAASKELTGTWFGLDIPSALLPR